MPQIAFIQPSAPQAPPPVTTPADNNTEGFSPHLNKALASRKDQPSSRESSSNPNERKTSDSKSRQGRETIGSEAPQEKVAKEETTTQDQTDPTNDIVNTLTMDQAVTKDQPDSSDIPLFSRHLTNIESLFAFLSKNLTNNNNENGKKIGSAQNSMANSPESNSFKTSLTETTVLPIAETGSVSPVIQEPKAQSANEEFLVQLQKIIENSNESGKVSITVTGNNLRAQPGLNALQNITSENNPMPPTIISDELTAFDVESPGVLLPINSEMPIEKANQNLTSMRHSIRQQYYEGQINPQNKQENQASSENGQQNNTFSPKTASTEETNTASGMTPEQTNTFAQPLASMQEGQKQPTVQTLQPVTLPSGTVVQQEEVIRQIVEHFQISRRNNDTRVNIQLHPAELGELKINLSVKEGAVRATVVASSQYAQDILEKNINKLKTILENQGFTIGEISVTSKSDTAGDFNLFDRQLFSQNDYTPPSTKNSRSREPLFTLENGGTAEQETMTGVNVKI